jgi:hypothetical protein
MYYFDPLPKSRLQQYFELRDTCLQQVKLEMYEPVPSGHYFDISALKPEDCKELIEAPLDLLRQIDNYQTLSEYGIRMDKVEL